jgi:tetratricopeptide (TPR) repeat protein
MLEGSQKYIDLPIPELYDLDQDPAEANNLAASRSDDSRRLARQIPPESAIGAAKDARAPTGAEEAAKLRSLGYLSGASTLKAKYTAADDPKSLVGVDQRLHECVSLYQLGRVPESIAVAREIVGEYPQMEIGYENLGFLLRQAGDSEAALAVYKKAVDGGIAGEELRRNYGLALSETGRAKEAVEMLAQIAGSSDPETVNAVGIAYSDAGREREAEAAFARALELDPRNVEAYVNLGIVRLRVGDPGGARDRFRQSLAIDPGVPRAWNGLGVALTRLGQEREAIDAWSRAVALDPHLYDALFNLGLVAAKHGLRRQAREALERFVAEAPPGAYGPDIEKAKRLLREIGESGA